MQKEEHILKVINMCDILKENSDILMNTKICLVTVHR